MRRLALIVVICAVGAAFVWSFMRQNSDLTVHSATAFSMGDGDMFMIGLTVDNAGPPEVLASVTSPGAQMASVMGGTGTLAIPSGGSGIFAMDGAHLMVRGASEGGFVPVTLTFASGAELTTRAKIADAMMMDHSAANGVTETPAPTLDIAFEGQVLRLQTSNLRLLRVEDDAPHVPGEGHAHVYLNGLKLTRLYENSLEIGALPAGAYTLRVSLNTHDHRPYLSEGAALEQVLEFTVP